MFHLSSRQRQPELMDQPGLDPRKHQQALVGLRRVNRLSRTAEQLDRELATIFPAANAPTRVEPLRVLDVAAGGGDIIIRLAHQARRRGVAVQFDGCDISPTAVELAQVAAARANLTNVRFFEHDIVSQDILTKDIVAQDLPQRYDVVMCSLFLHHLDSTATIQVLRRMAAAATQAVLVDDLRRTALGYVLAWWGCRLVTRSAIVHIDGPRSVRAAYTEQEVLELAALADLEKPSVRRHWPERFLMRWNTSGRRQD